MQGGGAGFRPTTSLRLAHITDQRTLYADDVTRIIALLAVTAATPVLGVWVWAICRSGDRVTPQPTEDRQP